MSYAPAAPGSRVTITEAGGKAFDPKANRVILILMYSTANWKKRSGG